MTHYFLDSSSLTKRYVIEDGSNWVLGITSSRSDHILIIARITQAEVFSGIARRQRESGSSERTLRAIEHLLDRHIRRSCTIIELTPSVAYRAIDLLKKYPLRAYDSIQLASALIANAKLIVANDSPVTFVCADQRLLDDAAAEGLSTDNPSSHL